MKYAKNKVVIVGQIKSIELKNACRELILSLNRDEIRTLGGGGGYWACVAAPSVEIDVI